MPQNSVVNVKSLGAQRQSTPGLSGPGDVFTTLVSIYDDGVVRELQNLGVPVHRSKGDGRQWMPIKTSLPSSPVPGDIWLEDITGQTYVRYTDSNSLVQTLPLAGGGGPISASLVTYSNTEFPTLTDVQLALDYLLHVNPVISSYTALTGGNSVLQPGQTAVDVNLSWARNKTVSAQTLTRNPGAVNLPIGSGILLYNDIGVNYTLLVPGTLDYELTIDDGVSTDTQTASISWEWLRIWGVSDQTIPDQALLAALSSETATTAVQTRTLTAASQFHYFAWPTSWAVTPTFLVNSIVNTGWTKTIVAFTNSYGITTNYDVYRSDYKQVNTVTIGVS